MTDLIKLAERCETEAGSRELDAAIAVAVKLDCRPNLPDDLEHLSLPNRHDPGPGVAAGHYWFHCRSGMSLRTAPTYTTSLDAALTLVPEGCDRADHVWPDTEGRFCTYLWAGKSHQIVGKSRAATPALALCAAALRARAGEG